jgi:GNAT superfamily N-acetyltransferase
VQQTIRDARPEDADAIADLLGQLGYPADGAAVGGRLERLRIVGDRVVVAEHDARVAGFAQLHVSPSIAYERPTAKIDALVVDEAQRGRGIGRALVGALEEEARVRGCVLLYVTTAARRKEAHAFYERVGLDETGKRFAKQLA